jgi:hypothetical protein
MAFARKASWRDWFREMFLRQGLFSVRPMPITRAEDALSTVTADRPKDITRLNLDAESTPRKR